MDRMDLVLRLKASFDDHGDTRLKQLRDHCYAAANQIDDDAFRIIELEKENQTLKHLRDILFERIDKIRQNCYDGGFYGEPCQLCRKNLLIIKGDGK